MAVIVAAIAAGLGYFSFWWTLIPAFFAGSFALSNHPVAYTRIMEANERGDWKTFPSMLTMSVSMSLGLAAVAYWITRAVTGLTSN